LGLKGFAVFFIELEGPRPLQDFIKPKTEDTETEYRKLEHEQVQAAKKQRKR